MQIKPRINPCSSKRSQGKMQFFSWVKKNFVICALISLRPQLSAALPNFHSSRSPFSHTWIVSTFRNALCCRIQILKYCQPWYIFYLEVSSFPQPLLYLPNSYLLFRSLIRCHFLWAIRIRNPFLKCLKNHILPMLCGEDAKWPFDLCPLFLASLLA